jgi:peptidoglycan/LPS O-acetylase OafA/YrhL
MANETDAPQRWLGGIEALRGIAAGAVVIHHSWSLSTQPHFFGYRIVAGFGGWGVDLFFVLSGFLLAEPFWRPHRAGRLRTYYVRRFFRIAPAYYLNIALLFLFFARHDLVYSARGVKQVVANVTFTHWLWPHTVSSFDVNGVLWTLSVEAALYIVMPALAIAVLRRPVLALSTAFACGLAYRVWVSVAAGGATAWAFSDNPGLDENLKRFFFIRQFPGIIPLFVLGIGLRYCVEHNTIRWPARLAAKPSLGVLFFLLLPSGLVLLGPSLQYRNAAWFSMYDILLALAFLPALAYASVPFSQPAGQVFRVSEWVGTRSYGLYLWHFPIILSVYGIGPGARAPITTHIGVRLLFIAVASVALAAVSYSAVEHPAREWGRRFARSRRMPLSTGA